MSSSVMAQRSSSEYCSHTLDILHGLSQRVPSGYDVGNIPLHPLWALLNIGRDLSQLPPQHADSLYGVADVVR